MEAIKMGDVLSGIGNAIGSAVDGLEQVGGDALQVGGKLLSNPAIDTALGSMIGCPELGMLGPVIGGLVGQSGGGSPLSALGQMPGMFGGGDPFGGLLNSGLGGLGNIFGGAGGAGLGGLPTGLLDSIKPILAGLGQGAGAGAGAGSGIPSAGGFDPTGGLDKMTQQTQQAFQLQVQMSAIQTAFQTITKEVSLAEDAAKTAINNIH